MTKKITGKEFFAGLYEEEQIMPSAEYDKIVSRLAVKTDTNAMFGDQAMQSMLVSFVHKNAQSLDQVKELSSALAGIKQKAISSVVATFPNANVDELVKSAKAAGFDVRIL